MFSRLLKFNAVKGEWDEDNNKYICTVTGGHVYIAVDKIESVEDIGEGNSRIESSCSFTYVAHSAEEVVKMIDDHYIV